MDPNTRKALPAVILVVTARLTATALVTLARTDCEKVAHSRPAESQGGANASPPPSQMTREDMPLQIEQRAVAGPGAVEPFLQRLGPTASPRRRCNRALSPTEPRRTHALAYSL